MKLQHAFRAIIASSLGWMGFASAQVVNVGFGSTVESVPLSPWMTGLMAGMLALAAIAFLRKHHRSGAFMLVLGLVAGGSALNSTDSLALLPSPPPLTLVTSPAIFDYTNFGSNCAKTVNVVSTVKAVINSISVTNGATDARLGAGVKASSDIPAWIVDPTSTCHIGSSLAAGGQCTVELVNNSCLDVK